MLAVHQPLVLIAVLVAAALVQLVLIPAEQQAVMVALV
jgi:hypothetical protein